MVTWHVGQEVCYLRRPYGWTFTTVAKLYKNGNVIMADGRRFDRYGHETGLSWGAVYLELLTPEKRAQIEANNIYNERANKITNLRPVSDGPRIAKRH